MAPSHNQLKTQVPIFERKKCNWLIFAPGIICRLSLVPANIQTSFMYIDR